MSGRIVNVRPKPGFMLDAAGDVIAMPGNVIPLPLRDGLASLMTGRGTSIDRTSSDFWSFMPANPQQLVAGYRSNWLVSKIIDIPAEDMVREWRDWQADDKQIAALEEAERNLDLIAKVQTAIAYGRLGGGVILMGFGDADPSQPAPPNPGKAALKYLQVFNRWEVGLGPMEMDIASANYGQPTYFTIGRDMMQTPIHPSRIVPFKGSFVPMMPGVAWQDHFWGDSIITRVDQAVKDAIRANSGFAALVDEAKIDVYRLTNLAETLMQPGGEDRMRTRMEITAQGKSVWRGVFMDVNDEWEQKQITWAGMPDLINTFLSVVSAAADIPATRMLGRSPHGMNATGDSDTENYHKMLRSKQRLYLSPMIDRIDKALIPSALGNRPDDVSYSWSALSVPNDKEMADTFKVMIDALSEMETNALAPSEVIAKAVRAYVSNEQLLPGWDDAYGEFDASGETFDPGAPDPSALVPIPGQPGTPPMPGAPPQFPGLPAAK